MNLIGVHQEPRAVVVNGEAKVVCDRLVHIQPVGLAKRRGEIDTFLPMVEIWAEFSNRHSVARF